MAKKINISQLKKIILQEIHVFSEQVKREVIGQVFTALKNIFPDNASIPLSQKLRQRRAARRPNATAKVRRQDRRAKAEAKSEFEKTLGILKSEDFKEVLKVIKNSPGLASLDPANAQQLLQIRRLLEDVIVDPNAYKKFSKTAVGQQNKTNFINNIKSINNQLKTAEFLTPTRNRFASITNVADDVNPGTLKPDDSQLDNIVDELHDLKTTAKNDPVLKGMTLEDTVAKIKINFDDSSFKALEKKAAAAGVIVTGGATLAVLASKGDHTKVSKALSSTETTNTSPTPTPSTTDPATPQVPQAGTTPASPTQVQISTGDALSKLDGLVVDDPENPQQSKENFERIRAAYIRVRRAYRDEIHDRHDQATGVGAMNKIFPLQGAIPNPASTNLESAKIYIISTLKGKAKKGVRGDFGQGKDISIPASEMKKLINDVIEGKYTSPIGKNAPFSDANQEKMAKFLSKDLGLDSDGSKFKLKNPLDDSMNERKKSKEKSYDLEFKKWSKLWK